ncbi:ankyrin, partial [Aspergillus phoenicis ATCC 13157]
LTQASSYGYDVKIVKALIAAGAGLDIRVNSSDEYGGTPLLNAVNSVEGHAKIFRLLLEAGANPHIADREGWTPLAYLLRFRQDNVQLFKLLLAAGVNVNVKTEDGWTPLALAANCGNLEAVKILLAAGADPNSGTPLTKAAFHEHLEIVKTL